MRLPTQAARDEIGTINASLGSLHGKVDFTNRGTFMLCSAVSTMMGETPAPAAGEGKEAALRRLLASSAAAAAAGSSPAQPPPPPPATIEAQLAAIAEQAAHNLRLASSSSV